MNEEFLRVVVVRRGKVRPTEFRLREAENGLSLFRKVDEPTSTEIIDAVRAAGKQGDLAVVEISVKVIVDLGLRIVATKGGTLNEAVNAIHIEPRPSLWRTIWLKLRGRPIHMWLNEFVTPRLAESARLID